MKQDFNISASIEAQYSQASKRSHVDNNSVLTSIMDRTPSMRAHFLQMEKYIKTHPSPFGEGTGVTPRDLLIVSNYRLAISIASRYRGNGLDMEDLIGFAYIGLTLAADHFDPTKGIDFAPYACRWIQGEICNGLNAAGHPIRLPKHLRSSVTCIREAQKQFFQQYGREAMLEELADMLNMKLENIVDILASTTHFNSLDTPIGDGEDVYTLADTIASEDTYEHDNEVHIRLKQALSALKPRERRILEGIYFEGKDFKQLSQELHITATRVRQIYRAICPKF